MPPAFATDPDRLRRFAQEALATSALNHPNILTTYDIGTDSGGPYLVAELLDGTDLRGHMDAPIPPRIAVGSPSTLVSVALSRDERRGAVARMDPSTGQYDVWQLEMGRDAPLRLTTDQGSDWTPTWSHDGTKLASSHWVIGLSSGLKLFK